MFCIVAFRVCVLIIFNCSGLHCCVQAFASCGEQVYSPVAVLGLLTQWLLLLWSTGSRAWAQYLQRLGLAAQRHVCKEIQPVHPKGDQSWVFIGRTDTEAEAPILWPPDAKNLLI